MESKEIAQLTVLPLHGLVLANMHANHPLPGMDQDMPHHQQHHQWIARHSHAELGRASFLDTRSHARGLWGRFCAPQPPHYRAWCVIYGGEASSPRTSSEDGQGYVGVDVASACVQLAQGEEPTQMYTHSSNVYIQSP